MTIDEFRKMALEIPSAVERSHMNHPDFRVAGRFSHHLGYPDENWGMVEAHAGAQRTFIEKAPEVFKPSSGAWGRQGYTNVCLASREGDRCVAAALDAAAKERRRIRSKENAERPTSNIQRPMIRIRSGQPLTSRLKKCVLECWLKRAGFCFAEFEIAADFELGGAMDFHVHSAVLC
jgi:hypothetical protein